MAGKTRMAARAAAPLAAAAGASTYSDDADAGLLNKGIRGSREAIEKIAGMRWPVVVERDSAKGARNTYRALTGAARTAQVNRAYEGLFKQLRGKVPKGFRDNPAITEGPTRYLDNMAARQGAWSTTTSKSSCTR